MTKNTTYLKKHKFKNDENKTYDIGIYHTYFLRWFVLKIYTVQNIIQFN